MSGEKTSSRLMELLRAEELCLLKSFPLEHRIALLELARGMDAYWFYCQGLSRDAKLAQRSTVWHALYQHAWHKALHLFLDNSAKNLGAPLYRSTLEWQQWADAALQHCGRIGACQRMLDLCEVGLVEVANPAPSVFRFTVSVPNAGQEAYEKEEFDYVGAMVRRWAAPALETMFLRRRAILTKMADLVAPWWEHYIQYETTPEIDDFYEQLGILWARPEFWYGADAFPRESIFGGLPFGLYLDAAVTLTGWALKHVDFAQALLLRHPDLELRNVLTVTTSRTTYAEYLSVALGVQHEVATQLLSTLTLDLENRDEHTRYPASYIPPLVAISSDAVIKSIIGLTGNSPQFLLHELRRRFPRDWDRSVEMREGAFRRDLYSLLPQPHVIKLTHRVRLRIGDRLLTDVDAVAFDDRSGTLGLFQLKWQDPFISSPRRWKTKKGNFLSEANTWIEVVSSWLRGKSPRQIAEGLGLKLPHDTTITQVRLFVLGRLFSHFSGEAAFDSRAAWGMWPQVMRLADQSYDHADPINWLFERLRDESPARKPVLEAEGFTLTLGDLRIVFEPNHG